MTVQYLAEARARRARLFNPPNGRDSTELEVVPTDRWTRKQSALEARIARQRAAEDFKRQSAIEIALKTARAADKLLGAIQERAHVKAIARRMLEDEGISEVNPPSIREICTEVRDYYGVTFEDFMSCRRPKPFSLARHVAMYLSRTLTFRSMPEIGAVINKRDHTTILYGVRKIEARIQTDPEFAAEVETIKARIRAKA